MAIKKRSTGAYDGVAARAVGLGAAYSKVLAVDVKASSDTTVSVAITDRDGEVIATIASADYTTRTRFFLVPVEARVFDTAGEVAAADSAVSPAVVARSPLTITPAGVGAGTVTVDVFVEV